MPNQVIRIENNGKSALEDVLGGYEDFKVLELLEKSDKLIRKNPTLERYVIEYYGKDILLIKINPSLGNYTFEYNGKIISVKELLYKDKSGKQIVDRRGEPIRDSRLRSFDIYQSYVNGIEGMPNITHKKEFCDENKWLFITEYSKLPGIDLAYLLENKIITEMLPKLTILLSVCYIVQKLHNNKVAHADIKDNNIICDGLNAYLVDWDSILKFQSPLTGLFSSGFSAPELIEESKPINEKVDVFSLGAVMYEFLYEKDIFNNNREPKSYDNDTGIEDNECESQEYLRILQKMDIEIVTTIWPNSLSSLLRRTLSYDPSGRPDIFEFTDILKNGIREFS